MCARFTVLNETPIAAAIADCVMSLSRSNTIEEVGRGCGAVVCLGLDGGERLKTGSW
jgi:hypothetical protein